MGRKTQPTEQRFWSHVAKTDNDSECWNWTGSLWGSGYGTTTLNQVRISSHRASWTLANGPIPAGLHVLHRCDNPLCCNPSHLFLGTHEENMRDMCTKNRRRTITGDACPWAKLTNDQVRTIRTLLSEGQSQRAIARQFNVSQPTIHYIASGHKWKSVK